MRIFIYPGSASCANFGDVAMLQIAVERLKTISPGAEISVLTRSPEQLAVHCPGVKPVLWRGCKRWLSAGVLPGWFAIGPSANGLDSMGISPANFWRLGSWVYPPHYQLARGFAEALFNSDLLLLSGCGVLADTFRGAALQILNTFAAARKRGLATAMVGQGLGPIKDPRLLRRAAEVLPTVGTLLLREQPAGFSLLNAIHVPTNQVTVTGDDAIELAWRERQPDLGSDLGFNLRIASYSRVDELAASRICELLKAKARQLGAKFVGLPVSGTESGASDVRTLQHLGVDCRSADQKHLCTTTDFIRQSSRCRVVVTGSYHAGVFALAQGIPTVAIAGSAYYQDKFDGLAAQFGSACVVLRADDSRFDARLSATVESLWQQAEELRGATLESAERQIRFGQDAYVRLIESVRSQGMAR